MSPKRKYTDRVKRHLFCETPRCPWNNYPVYGRADQLWDPEHWPRLQRFWVNGKWLCFRCSNGKGLVHAPKPVYAEVDVVIVEEEDDAPEGWDDRSLD